jgi:hypothetical protein
MMKFAGSNNIEFNGRWDQPTHPNLYRPKKVEKP